MRMVLASLCVVVAFAFAAPGQEAKQPPAKADKSTYTPPGYKQLNPTKDLLVKFATIRNMYFAKIKELETQIAKIKSDEKREFAAVLTPDQHKQLAAIVLPDDTTTDKKATTTDKK